MVNVELTKTEEEIVELSYKYSVSSSSIEQNQLYLRELKKTNLDDVPNFGMLIDQLVLTLEKCIELDKSQQKLKNENQQLCEKLEEMKIKDATLEEKIKFKQIKLEGLKNELESYLDNDSQKSSLLETLLVSQEKVVRLEGGDSQVVALSERQLNKAKENLKDKLSVIGVEFICQKKRELTQLEMELESSQADRKEFEARQEIPLKNNK